MTMFFNQLELSSIELKVQALQGQKVSNIKHRIRQVELFRPASIEEQIISMHCLRNPSASGHLRWCLPW
jgi:hypothetical protein